MMTLHICMSIYIFKFTKVFFMAELKETVFFSDFKNLDSFIHLPQLNFGLCRSLRNQFLTIILVEVLLNRSLALRKPFVARTVKSLVGANERSYIFTQHRQIFYKKRTRKKCTNICLHVTQLSEIWLFGEKKCPKKTKLFTNMKIFLGCGH